MIEKSGIFNQQINALLPNNNYISEFLFYLFDTNFFKQLLIQQTHNTTVPIINKSKFSNIKIPLPPLEAQEKIVKECEEVEEKFKTIRMSIEEYKSLIKEILIKSCVITDASLEIGGGMSKI